MRFLFFSSFFLFFLPVGEAKNIYIHAGPEVYSLCRIREGGTRQDGRMDGIRIGFDRLMRYSWYLGMDYLYANGKLRGENRSEQEIKSELTDSIVEFRFGYMLQNATARQAFFTFFGGYGYFCETNDFSYPTPIPFTFTDSFNFAVAGFLSGFNFTPLLSMGINFKVRFMLNGKSEVTDDPFFEDETLSMRDESHYRLEIPFMYRLSPGCPLFDALATPFYEYRHFGGQEGFPFDFIDTKFHLFGMRFALAYRF